MIIHNNKNFVKKVLLTGGGTGGSVSPLLAIAEELKETKSPIGDLVSWSWDFLWIGTKNGPEEEMVSSGTADPEPSSSGRANACSVRPVKGIKFKPIFSGKFRRYFSWRNFVDPFLILIGFFQSFFIILKWKPDLVISAGSFVSVPVVWAAWILRVPVLIHQQDARPGLANKLMAPFAKVITVTFKESLEYYGKKAVWTGNPVRELRIKNSKFEIKNKNNLPTVLVIGGGTGAEAINELIRKGIDELAKFCRIIHITGKNKKAAFGTLASVPNAAFALNYKSFEFLNADQMAKAYAAADIAVSRCGMGVLTELSYLGKPAILIPMPDSHQEDNAKIFKDKDAAIVLNQKKLTAGILVENIKNLINNKEERDKLSNNIQRVIKSGANKKIAEIIKSLCP